MTFVQYCTILYILGGEEMTNPNAALENLITIKDLIVKWDVSRHTIFGYLQENRIKGAVKLGHKWYFPKDIEKPEDRRFKKQAR